MRPFSSRSSLGALFAAILVPALAGAQVVEIPVINAGLGSGAGQAGASANSGGISNNASLGLSAPTLTGTQLPAALSPKAVSYTQPLALGPAALNGVQSVKGLPTGSAAPLPGRSVGPEKTGDAQVPNIGGKSSRDGLKTLRSKTGAINQSLGGSQGSRGGERVSAIGSSIFDGGGFGKPGAVDGGGGSGSGEWSFPNHNEALAGLGVPRNTVARLNALLARNHPGDQDAVYHNAAHSIRVATVMSAILHGPAARGLTARDKVLLLVSAALHDVDPGRVPGTPARVPATLAHIDSDPEVRTLLFELNEAVGIDPAQVKALIKFTDFSLDAEAMAKIQTDARALGAQAFEGSSFDWASWGPRLAFADQSAMYAGTPEFAHKAVLGLANEIRAGAEAAQRAAGTYKGPVTMPTDEMILKGTPGFLNPLMTKPEFALLPGGLQRNFYRVAKHFEDLASGRADEVSATVSYVERYIRGIAGNSKLRPDQRRGLFVAALEEKGITLDSELGRAVEARMYPGTAAKKEAGRALISPRFAHFADSILILAREYEVDPKRVEALIRNYPDADGFLAGSRNKEQIERTLEQILRRDRVSGLVRIYPNNAQGAVLRSLAEDILTPSGKSIEETTRAGAFIYVNFSGNSVRDATTGRDPDNRAPHRVFYATLEPGGLWKIGGYRRNGGPAGGDAEMVSAFKNWLAAGGIPAGAFKP